MTTDEAIAEITAAGFTVNNLFQCNTTQWQANLRSDKGHTQYCIAPTPAEALEGCLLLLNDLTPAIVGREGFTIDHRPSLSSILITTHTPINRRF